MTDKGKHTELPFEVNVWTTGRREVTAQNGLVICEVHQVHDKEQQKANAAFIVQACNNFEALREALVSANHALKSYQYGNGSPDLAEEVSKHIEQALANSEEPK